MRTILFFLSLFFSSAILYAQSPKIKKDKAAIRAVMDIQAVQWSTHNIDGFMETYWKSDSLKFYGSRGITYGWEQTLVNYKKGYPTPKDTGILTFKLHDISPTGKKSYWVMGEYFLKREAGDANGIFMIIFRKVKGKWKIVADMSCG